MKSRYLALIPIILLALFLILMMSEAQAVREFEALGFAFVGKKPGLPWQHLLVFEKPGHPPSNPPR